MKKIGCVSLLFILFSCDEGELYRVCDESLVERKCVVENNQLKIYKEGNEKNYTSTGICILGITECTEQGELVCVGYQGPQEEVCDGLDNDCDFDIDEGFDQDGDGETICAGDCDDTDSAINALQSELCDGVDNNCDGNIDDLIGIECWDGPDDAVFGHPSTCYKGVAFCIDGGWTECRFQHLPSHYETCDGLDNNCNGIVDEDPYSNGMHCGPTTDLGACSFGGEICIAGESYCANPFPVLPQLETCDGIDNDCDGEIDEELSRMCNNICGSGEEYCISGEWEGCTAPQPIQEFCDGLDNDCDGEIDEDCICDEGQFVFCRENVEDEQGNFLNCGVGISYCDENGNWGRCEFVGVEPESCDGLDNDCDGQIDHLFAECGLTDLGQCQFGEVLCESGEWSECDGAVYPEQEICDGLDNDCDGEVDNGLNPNERVDMVFVLDVSGSMSVIIDIVSEALGTYVSRFEGSEHRFGLITFPTNPSSSSNDVQVRTNPSLSTVNEFISTLSMVDVLDQSFEPSLDALQWATDVDDPLNINWRADAKPYVVLITDEMLDSGYGNTPLSIAQNTTNCQIGNCSSGDRVEIFGILLSDSFIDFAPVVYGEIDRLWSITPVDTDRYTNILGQILEDVCVYNQTDSVSTNDAGN